MAKTEFDSMDLGLLVLSMMMSFIMVGIGSFDLFGVDFGAVVTTVAGIELTTAYVLSAGAIVGVVATNDNTSFNDLRDDVEKLDQYYAFSVVATFGFMAAWLVFPGFVDFVQSTDLWGLVYVMIVSAGTFVMGWIL